MCSSPGEDAWRRGPGKETTLHPGPGPLPGSEREQSHLQGGWRAPVHQGLRHTPAPSPKGHSPADSRRGCGHGQLGPAAAAPQTRKENGSLPRRGSNCRGTSCPRSPGLLEPSPQDLRDRWRPRTRASPPAPTTVVRLLDCVAVSLHRAASPCGPCRISTHIPRFNSVVWVRARNVSRRFWAPFLFPSCLLPESIAFILSSAPIIVVITCGLSSRRGGRHDP